MELNWCQCEPDQLGEKKSFPHVVQQEVVSGVKAPLECSVCFSLQSKMMSGEAVSLTRFQVQGFYKKFDHYT